MAISLFDKLSDGREVTQYVLANRAGMTAKIINYGATLTSLSVADRDGKVEDVVLGHDSVQGYIEGTAYFGATVGRYSNRIGKGSFELDGKQYQLTINNGPNRLHGGKIGFSKVLWDTKTLSESEEPSVEFVYVSRDGEEGYPGKVTLKVVYILTAANELRIDYEGTTDKPTILNPTHHSYFNLTGSFTNTILDHLLTIEADSFIPVDEGLIPTGQYMKVTDTPMDFRVGTAIGARIDNPDEQLVFGRGYDHNWILRDGDGKLRKAAEVYDPTRGLGLKDSSEMLKNYNELKVWQKSYQLCLEIYRATTKVPKEERFGLTSQIRRAVVSVVSNIAEGYGRKTITECIRFLFIAYGSNCELETQMLLSGDLGTIESAKLKGIKEKMLL